jgi:phosphate transport system permease protein
MAGLSVVLMVIALFIILGPMVWRGSSAVVFKGTVEFRKMQWQRYQRGDVADLDAESKRTDQMRSTVYNILNRFREGIDTSHLSTQVRQIFRQFGRQLELRDTPTKEYTQLRGLAKTLRDNLEQAFQSVDKTRAAALLASVLEYESDPRLKHTEAEQFFTLAQQYQVIVNTVDLAHRAEYAQALAEVQEEIRQLFGPPPGTPVPALAMDQYGATRWDRAQIHLQRLLYAEEWIAVRPGEPLQKRTLDRQTEQFAGTELAAIFPLIKDHLHDMLQPRWTFYRQFFMDDSTPGHYFGGVGPEILGTFLLTVLTMVFAIPLGVISAAYLIECAGNNHLTRLIRTCINTLAGVPSIVFGLFGLAFFVLVLLPFFGQPSKSSILAGSLTLALLVLPVIIRASEEAIRSVPQTYKEAALALGASNFRAFVTVILPAALPGILTGVILSLSRAAGETAPILFTAAVAVGPIPESLSQQTRTLSYGSYDMAVGDRLAALVPHNQFGMVMSLILMVLTLNILAIMIRSRIARKLRGQ